MHLILKQHINGDDNFGSIKIDELSYNTSLNKKLEKVSLVQHNRLLVVNESFR